MDPSTFEPRACELLHGLGFSKEMMQKALDWHQHSGTVAQWHKPVVGCSLDMICKTLPPNTPTDLAGSSSKGVNVLSPNLARLPKTCLVAGACVLPWHKLCLWNLCSFSLTSHGLTLPFVLRANPLFFMLFSADGSSIGAWVLRPTNHLDLGACVWLEV